MTAVRPFDHPPEPHARRHGPLGYADYGDMKPFLRDDFAFRCAYCLDRERWYPPGHGAFSADHVVPKSAAPDRTCDYENLAYACCLCNSFKSTKTLPDPAAEGIAAHLAIEPTGEFRGLTDEGREAIKLLHLNTPDRIVKRAAVPRVAAMMAAAPDDVEVAELYHAHFGFPDDLPDLRRNRPPDGNTRPEGVSASHLARRERGELPEVY